MGRGDYRGEGVSKKNLLASPFPNYFITGKGKDRKTERKNKCARMCKSITYIVDNQICR